MNIQYLYTYLISQGMKLLSIFMFISGIPHVSCSYPRYHKTCRLLYRSPSDLSIWRTFEYSCYYRMSKLKKINTSTQLVCENGHTHPTWVHTPSMLTCTRMRIYGATVSNQSLKTSHANNDPINYMPPNQVVYIEFLVC